MVFDGAQPSLMSIFKTTRVGRVLAIILASVIGLSMSSIALTTQAEAPDPAQLIAIHREQGSDTLVDGLTQQERAAKIDAFYTSRGNLPLAGYGLAMVQAADEYGIDWRLVAAIGFIESTGGKFACKKVTFSAFGWGSCTINFSSYEESIDVISKNLGGHNPNTARYYADKTIPQILDAYNPPSIRPDYKKLVMGTMEKISLMNTQ